MKKIFAISVFFIASLFILIGNLKPVSAQENLPKLAKVSKMNENIKKYFEKSKQFSKEKWENFQTIRDDYFTEPIEVKFSANTLLLNVHFNIFFKKNQ